MNTRLIRVASAVLTCGFLTGAGLPGTAGARDPQPVDIRPPADAGVRLERVYYVAEGLDADAVIALRNQLVAAGARSVNVFLPDNVIVAEVPPGMSVAVPAAFRVETAASAAARTRFAAEPWGWIADSYALAQRVAAGEGRAALFASADGDAGFRDHVVTSTPEQVREVQRVVEKAWSQRGVSFDVAAARLSNQNSEFLGGSILANFVFPESNGTRGADTHNWSEDDLREARIGSAAAFLAWQQWTQMDIQTIFQMFERVATGYEPISHTMETDRLWILDTMHTLGYGLHSSDPISAVHEFNEEQRALRGTQWVVTSLIANSRNVANHLFGNGTVGYTAYANLGGPYMVQPFPSGSDPNSIGEGLVYSQIVQHEVGHCFWTLDEYPGAPGGCTSLSGYLSYDNRNVTLTGPSGEQYRCEPLQNCIMNNAPRLDLGRPWCRYSLGHLGVIDNNNNAVPDIFEADPEIVFAVEGPETVSTNEYVLRFKARSRAVPNRNPYMADDRRIDYAVRLRRVVLEVGDSQIELDPVDGVVNEVEEDFEFRMSLATVGQSALMLRATNDAGFVSRNGGVKRIYFAGVNYSRTAAAVKNGRIEVTWETAGEAFGATFDVFRLARGQAMPGDAIAGDVSPSGPPSAGFTPYRWVDKTVVPGQDYRYYVKGSFVLQFLGQEKEYVSTSRVIEQTAMLPLPVGELVSNVSPNPTRGSVTFSIQVPRTYDNDPRAPQRLATDVDVRVYDVRGRLVRTVHDAAELSDVLTLRWDGSDVNNVQMPSGVYFLRVKSTAGETVRKIVLVR